MSKLQKYNQKIQAILSTLVLISIVVLLIIGLVSLIMDTIERERYNKIDDNSILISEPSDSLSTIKQLKQDITFDNPRLIDSAKNLYIIAVSQVNLENNFKDEYSYMVEPLKAEGILLYNRNRRFSYNQKKSFQNYSGEFNNVIVYNEAENKKEILFDQKIYITGFSNHVIDSSHYLLITGAIHDSNKDNKLNYYDLAGLFVYNLDTKEMKEFEIEKHSFESFYFQHESNELILQYTVDKNNNGKINYKQEPVILKKLNFSNWEINDFVSSEKMNELQNLIN